MKIWWVICPCLASWVYIRIYSYWSNKHFFSFMVVLKCFFFTVFIFPPTTVTTNYEGSGIQGKTMNPCNLAWHSSEKQLEWQPQQCNHGSESVRKWITPVSVTSSCLQLLDWAGIGLEPQPQIAMEIYDEKKKQASWKKVFFPHLRLSAFLHEDVGSRIIFSI